MNKWITPLLVAFVGCNPLSNEPITNHSSNTFPTAFKETTVSFRNLPDEWESQTWIWEKTGPGQWQYVLADGNNGSGYFSGNWEDDFLESSFTQSGDSIRSQDLVIVLDSISGMIKSLHLSLPTDSLTYTVDCLEIPYQLNSANSVLITPSWQTIRQEVTNLTNSTQNGDGGEINDTTNVFSGIVSDSAFFQIQLKP
jgi:hypothetical protein